MARLELFGRNDYGGCENFRGQVKPAVKNQSADSRAERAETERHFAELRHKAEDAAEKAFKTAVADELYDKIHKELNELSIQLAFAEIRNAADAEKISERISALETQGDERLKLLGLSKADFTPNYACKKCNDTGYDKNGKPCECMKKFIATLR